MSKSPQEDPKIDILEELVKDKDYVKPGIYKATVASVTFDVTKARMMPFAKIKCCPQKVEIPVNFFVFVYIHTPDQLMFLKYLLPKMIGDIVDVKVQYREFNETSYRDCRMKLNVQGNSPQD